MTNRVGYIPSHPVVGVLPTTDTGWLRGPFEMNGAVWAIGSDGTPYPLSTDIVYPIGGQFLLNANEFNGWGNLGPIDNTNAQDLGNVGADPNRLSGGICYPFDVDILGLYAWHQNNNAAAQAWGWRLVKQAKTAGSNAVVSTDIISEVADNGGVGPRNYSNAVTQQTDIDLTGVAVTLAAGEVLILGVEAPTADPTNRYVRVMSGYIHMRRRLV